MVDTGCRVNNRFVCDTAVMLILFHEDIYTAVLYIYIYPLLFLNLNLSIIFIIIWSSSSSRVTSLTHVCGDVRSFFQDGGHI